jgi:hypothetical protein
MPRYALRMETVPGRECEGCAVCCTELHINDAELKKLARVRCPNLRDDCLCAIYETRPRSCRVFECGWKSLAMLGDHWRPDRSGLVLIPKMTDNPPGYREGAGVQILLLKRGALALPELPGLIAQWFAARVPMYLSVTAPTGFVAKAVFLNDRVMHPVRRKDRAALIRALGEMADALARQKLELADFAHMPGPR